LNNPCRCLEQPFRQKVNVEPQVPCLSVEELADRTTTLRYPRPAASERHTGSVDCGGCSRFHAQKALYRADPRERSSRLPESPRWPESGRDLQSSSCPINQCDAKSQLHILAAALPTRNSAPHSKY
jgi:hypothetical protein